MGFFKSVAALAAVSVGVEAASVLGNSPFFSNSSSSAIHLHNSTSSIISHAAPSISTTTVYKTVQAVDPTDDPVADSPFSSPAPSASASPGEGYNRFGFKGEQTATFATSGPIATLSPNVHWSWDTKSVKNVVPVPVGKGSQMYYGVGGKTRDDLLEVV